MISRNQRKSRRILVAIMMALAVMVVVFGSVTDDVYAGGRVGDYGIREQGESEDSKYPECVFADDYFDTNGNLTIEFKSFADKGAYSLLVQDETAKKVYINADYYAFKSDYLKLTYFIINHEKLIKNNGKSIVLNKGDFKKNPDYASTYGQNYGDVTIGTVTSDKKNMWYQGFWFDANGENTYDAIGAWKGTGDWQWYEDSNGWYPAGQWQKMDKVYDPYSGNGHPASCSSSRTWGGKKMYVEGWFYFDENGYALRSGWHKIDGSWYYFDDFLYEGNCWRDGYYIDYNGTQNYAYTGSWKGDASGWWFEDTSGWYPVNKSQIIDGSVYYFKSNGYMAADEWIAPGESGNAWDNIWIHVNSSGVEDKTGYYENNKWIEVKGE